jgi:enoyl-[acyl-carrier protein] reductase I
VDIDDVGMAAAYLAMPYARRITGSTVFVDAGLNFMA